MNQLLRIALFALGALSLARANQTTQPWFAGMTTPPKVNIALPADFIVVSASPDARTTKAFDMYNGNIWAPPVTAKQFEYGASTKLNETQTPLFFVHLSEEVGQQPGTDTFNNERNLDSNYRAAGLKNVKSAKTKWGPYPVLSLTGDRPDGVPFFIAWIGINSPEGWAIVIDYRVPRGKGHPTDEERQIWNRLLSETR